MIPVVSYMRVSMCWFWFHGWHTFPISTKVKIYTVGNFRGAEKTHQRYQDDEERKQQQQQHVLNMNMFHDGAAGMAIVED